MALDLGCGVGLHRSVCEKLAYDWVGLDHTEAQAPILGDAHALPFASETFEFIAPSTTWRYWMPRRRWRCFRRCPAG
jgi:hypothetical protein